MGMRLPGGVHSPDTFWDMMIQKKDGLCEVPKSRYNIDGFYSTSKPHLRNGMDPQQRMLLEVIWECLESAGETNWWGKNIGCYVGVFGEDWLESSLKDSQNIDRFHAVGTGLFVLSNRISYEFDFRGPRSNGYLKSI
ncbi:thiolase-like protein [Aspergillus alliaceus]|uniref:Thiolase-like protein n=1 Tax=Petromyces alliaceus TaxID=209559 RepID=A0A5N7BXF6_PETAA|nr:thiolase-like protein [Aspergillus alliaceus]